MNREGSSNSDKENIQQPSTSAGSEPSEEDICDKETKRTYVEDMFEHELETTRVCMICEKASRQRLVNFILPLLPVKDCVEKTEDGRTKTPDIEMMLAKTLNQIESIECNRCAEKKKRDGRR